MMDEFVRWPKLICDTKYACDTSMYLDVIQCSNYLGFALTPHDMMLPWRSLYNVVGTKVLK